MLRPSPEFAGLSWRTRIEMELSNCPDLQRFPGSAINTRLPPLKQNGRTVNEEGEAQGGEEESVALTHLAYFVRLCLSIV